MGAGIGSGRGSRRAGRRGRRRVRHRPMAEINVTPMVDVMLVLLIIFMVAAPLLEVGVPVELPETKAQPLPVEEEAPLVVSLRADGSIWLQREQLPPEALIARLRAVAAERRSRKVFLRADGALPYADVARIMGALSAAGFNDIGLVTAGPQAGRRDGG